VVVEELEPAAGAALFEQACRDGLGVSAEAFLAARADGAYPADWSPQEIQRLEFLLPFVD
jgi:hypothetical protein